MSLFKSFFAIAVLFSVDTFAEIPKLTPDQFRRFVASEYAKEFANEFNLYKKVPEAKNAFDLLYEPKFHKRFTRWNEKTSVKADGPVLIIQHDKQKPVRIEITSLYGQQYKINGKKFAHSWNANPVVEAEVVARTVAPKSASIMDLLLPESEAAGPAIAAGAAGVVAAEAEAAVGAAIVTDVALIAMRTAAVRMAAQGAAETALAQGTGSAAVAAETQAGAVAATERLIKAAELLVKDPSFRQTLGKEIAESASKHQAVANAEMMATMKKTLELTQVALEKANAAAQSPYMPGRLLLSLVKVADAKFWQISTLVLGISLANKTNFILTFQCLTQTVLTGKDQCEKAAAAVDAGKEAPVNPPKLVTCYKKEGNDLTGYYDKRGLRKDAFSVHFGSPGADGKAPPVSATGFVLDENEKVVPDSVRQYDITYDPTQTGDKIFRVTNVDKWHLRKDEELSGDVMLPKFDLSLSTNEALIEDMKRRQDERDSRLVSHKVKSEKAVSKELLDKFYNNKDTIKNTQGEDANELSLVGELTLLYNTLNGGCTEISKADPKTVSAAASGDTGVPTIDGKAKTNQ